MKTELEIVSGSALGKTLIHTVALARWTKAYAESKKPF
jgi:hypothetical protein